MTFELILLGALIFVFIISFCGLLQKIKQSYQQEMIIAERVVRRREAARDSSDSFSHVNTTYLENESPSAIFPGAPPPYSYVDPPPKYEDIIKNDVTVTLESPVPVHSNPRPFTIS